ncbi:MAG: hypothetical protein WDA65_01885 [Christensenellales bacterium]
MQLFLEFKSLIKKNIREYGMYIALVVICAFFAIMTKGNFMSSRNISNLISQSGYVAVLAVGMTLVLIIKWIDLSIGFVAGFLGALAAVLIVQQNMPMEIACIIVILAGIGIGMFNGFLVAKVGVPAFVTTLAVMLIFRGSLLEITGATGTIVIPDEKFNAIGNGFIPDIANVEGIHVLTLIIGMLAIVAYIISQFISRKNLKRYQFEVISMPIFIFKLIFISVLIGYIVWILAGYNGLSWTAVVVALVVVIYHFIMSKTALGRHIYGVGGNKEAAELSGINVRRITFLVFTSMGMLAGLAGLLYTSRQRSAMPTAGTLFELDAIAAAFVGGVSAAGGVGKVTGSIIGALVMCALPNGMKLMGVSISYEYIIRGVILVLAVVFDITTRKTKS